MDEEREILLSAVKRREFIYDFGDTVRDTLNGYEGKISARYEYSNGCLRYMVETRNTQDGGVHELVFDEERLERIEPAKEPVKRSNTGGADRSIPSRTGVNL